ncbi:MAG TPA: hypothetical protein PLF81_10160 [Candidatus Anammoximicrobium sp.]|nr:hypothetical protein [Candidatus Anammoximicrobium sp.]
MSRLTWCLTILSVLAAGRSVQGADLFFGSLGRELKCTRCAVVPCCCTDNYCRKPLPCLPCVPLPTACDNYCRKPLPCIPCVKFQCCADDYCRKPFPQLCCPAK